MRIHLRYVLDIFSVLGIVLHFRHNVGDYNKENSCPHKAHILVREERQKYKQHNIHLLMISTLIRKNKEESHILITKVSPSR